jgi:cation transport regulator ChaC
MLTRRLKSRAPSALVVGNGYVEGHRISFDKVSADGSGKCDIRPSGNPADRVHGVLFSIDVRDRSRLEREEGVGASYRTNELQVATQAGVSAAVAYIAEHTNEQLRPYDWYKEIVVAGAVEHELPAEYVDTLSGVASQPDSDDHRNATNRAFLADIKL